jgi:hypothetical protein
MSTSNIDALSYLIPMDRFDSTSYIDGRLAKVGPDFTGSLRTTLTYLYSTDGPINLPRQRLMKSLPYLEPARPDTRISTN